jgi:DNA mismatch repair protein MSH3
VGSLLSILNHTSTSAGARRLRDWIRTPLRSIPEILERQRTVESLAFPPGALSTEAAPHRIAYEELTTAILPRCRHLLKFLQQVHLGKATPSHAVGALQILRDVEAHVTSLRTTFAAATDSPQPARKQDQVTLVEQLLEGYPTLERHLSGLLEEIDATHARQNDVEKTVQRRLHRRPAQARQYRAFVQELELLDRQYDAVLVCCRGILKSPSLEYSTFRGGSLSDIRHLIPVDRAHLHQVPQGWLVVNSTKKLVRFHPEEVVQLHVQEEFVKEQKQQLLRSTWRQFVRDVDAAVYVPGVKCVEILATLDALCSLATVAQSYPNYARPEFVEAGGATLQIADGRHPVVERLLEGTAYIGNSVSMSSSVAGAGSVLVVSGPNMGGKTSLLRMCALVVILAQMGSFVPAASVRLSVFDGIHTLMHRSTTPFRPQGRGSPPCAQELAALGSISRHATKRSLVLVDEIGFGMPAHYAEAVAIAQMRYLVEAVGSQVVFATHLTTSIEKLQARLGDKCRAKRLEYHFYDQTPTFHYVLRDGIASESFAIETARRAGIPPEILERAHSFQRNLQ